MYQKLSMVASPYIYLYDLYLHMYIIYIYIHGYIDISKFISPYYLHVPKGHRLQAPSFNGWPPPASGKSWETWRPWGIVAVPWDINGLVGFYRGFIGDL
jgi:hypothetical protein